MTKFSRRVVMAGFLLFFCGCDLMLNFVHKEMAQEKTILGEDIGPDSKTQELQQRLAKLGYNPGREDGKIGFRTRQAIKSFQKDYELAINGFATRETWDKLTILAQEKRSVSKPQGIQQIQQALLNAGFNPGPLDGKAGAKTKNAVRAFQKAQNLYPDGVVGPKTWQRLREYLGQDPTSKNIN